MHVSMCKICILYPDNHFSFIWLQKRFVLFVFWKNLNGYQKRIEFLSLALENYIFDFEMHLHLCFSCAIFDFSVLGGVISRLCNGIGV